MRNLYTQTYKESQALFSQFPLKFDKEMKMLYAFIYTTQEGPMSIDFDNVENLIFNKEPKEKTKRSIDLDSIEDHFFGNDTKIPPVKKKLRSRKAPSKTNHR